MPKIKNGLYSKLAVVVAVLTLVPPLVQSVVNQIENVATHWGSGEEVSLITGAAVVVIGLIAKAIQAAAAIWAAKDQPTSVKEQEI